MKHDIQKLLNELFSYTEIPSDYPVRAAQETISMMRKEFQRLESTSDENKQKRMITLFIGAIVLALKQHDLYYCTKHYPYSHSLLSTFLMQGITSRRIQQIGAIVLSNPHDALNALDPYLEHLFPQFQNARDKINLLVDFCICYSKDLNRSEVDSDELDVLKLEKMAQKEKELEKVAQKEKELKEIRNEETRQKIRLLLQDCEVTLTEAEEALLKNDDAPQILAYIDKYLPPLLPEFCKQEKSEMLINLISSRFEELSLSKNILSQIVLTLSEGTVFFYATELDRPKAEHTVQIINCLLSKSLKNTPKELTASVLVDIQDALINNSQDKEGPFNLLLNMASVFSNSLDSKKQHFSDKTIPFIHLPHFRDKGITSLFKYYCSIAQFYINTENLPYFANLCTYLRDKITFKEYKQFEEIVFTAMNEDGMGTALIDGVTKIFDTMDSMFKKEINLIEASKQAAEQKAAKEAADKAAQERAAKEAAEKAAQERAAKEAADKAAQERAAKEAAEKVAQERAAKEAAEKAAQERAAKEAAEKAAQERAAKEAAEKAAQERAAKEAADKAAQERAAKEAADKAAQERAAKEAAEKAAQERTAKEAADKAAQEATYKERAVKKPNKDPVDILCEIIDQLIDNITKGTQRCTSGKDSKKVADLETIKNQISLDKDFLQEDSYNQCLLRIKRICEQKRNPLHLWQTPHSVKEFEALLKQHNIDLPSSSPESDITRSKDI